MRQVQLEVYAWRAMLSIEDDAEQTGDGISNEPAQPFGLSEHGLWFSTAREAVVPLLVEFHASQPPLPGPESDMVLEATVESPSGRLSMIFPEDELQMVVFAVGSGFHNIRVWGAHVDDADPLEDAGPDHYGLQLWPAMEMQRPNVVRMPAFLGPTGQPRFS